MNKPMTFYQATVDIKKKPIGNWQFEKWPRKESSFGLKSPQVSIWCKNGKDFFDDNDIEGFKPEAKKLFVVRIYVNGSKDMHDQECVSPDDLRLWLENKCQSYSEKYPFKAPLPKPLKKTKKAKKRGIVPELKNMDIKFKKGQYVKIIDGPYPKVMKKNVQRVEIVHETEVYVVRWHQRFMQNVASWIPKDHLEILEGHIPPSNYCLTLASNTSNSGFDALKRGHCTICTVKAECVFWNKHGRYSSNSELTELKDEDLDND